MPGRLGAVSARACDELAHPDDQPPAVRHPRQRGPAVTHASEVRRGAARSSRRDVAEREVAAQRHAMPERREPRDHLGAASAGFEIGKNVPEKRNIGRIRKRKIAMNETSVLRVRGPGRDRRSRSDSPTRTVTGIASTPSGELDRAERGDDDEVDRSPSASEPEREERLVAEHDVSHRAAALASIAWYCRSHLIAEKTGKARLERRRAASPSRP